MVAWISLVILVFCCVARTLSEPYYGAGLEINLLHTNDVHSTIDEIRYYGRVCYPADSERGECLGGASRL